jgi:hypothetical protein
MKKKHPLQINRLTLGNIFYNFKLTMCRLRRNKSEKIRLKNLTKIPSFLLDCFSIGSNISTCVYKILCVRVYGAIDRNVHDFAVFLIATSHRRS